MISHKHKFIFFHVPKAAGSSVIKAVKNEFSNDVVVNDQNKNFTQWLENNSNTSWPNHVNPGLMLHYLGYEKFYSYYKFAFVRNPYAKLVSLYHYTKQKEPKIYAEKGLELPPFSVNILNTESFKEWILTGDFGNAQADFLSVNGDLAVNFVGQTENLQNDFDTVFADLNLRQINLPNANVSVHDEESTYIDEETEEIIFDRYRRDFQLFNYRRLYGRELDGDTLETTGESQIVHIENTNDYTYPIDNSNIQIHPNNINENPVSVFYLAKKSNFLEINTSANNENSRQKRIVFQIENEDTGYHENLALGDSKEQKLVLKLNPQKQNLIKIKCYLENIYSSENYYCGINFHMKYI